LVFGRVTAPKSLLFGGFTPSVVRRSWHMSARG
jgi:hypothetical protein